ncbi:hypothetical protein [Parendozoicomonas haliclonae]|uniref:Uncharacterized protein n=1 Tax=Parendozoicomonas haliclonae TaxID=1960125 RepID=A0A1X7AM28_9GAMM|nr:hypothetical protein [Parendozoicomonas haliclonae]SMA48912.1 hypothetical protein EHSB41UT_02967 [Parendozoicomonas haliclonae]
MSEEQLTFIVAVTGIISSIAAIISAIAAWRAVVMAKRSSDKTQLIEKRQLILEIISACRDSLNFTIVCQNLYTEIKRDLKSHATITGKINHSGYLQTIEDLNSEYENIIQFSKGFEDVMSNQEFLHSSNIEDLHKKHSQVSMYQARIIALQQKMQSQHYSIKEMVTRARDRATSA